MGVIRPEWLCSSSKSCESRGWSGMTHTHRDTHKTHTHASMRTHTHTYTYILYNIYIHTAKRPHHKKKMRRGEDSELLCRNVFTTPPNFTVPWPLLRHMQKPRKIASVQGDSRQFRSHLRTPSLKTENLSKTIGRFLVKREDGFTKMLVSLCFQGFLSRGRFW